MILDDSIKQRILSVLEKGNSLPINKIAEKTNICVSTASKYIHILEAEKNIKIQKFGNMKMVSKK